MEDQEAVNLAADWADISQGLRKDLGHQLHSQWIRPIQVGGIDKDTGTLDLFLPTEFSANWVKDRFADRLSLAWKIARSEVRDVRIQVHPGRRQVADLRLHADGRRPANDGADTSMMAIGADTLGDTGFTSSVGLDPSLTFAAFITGEANVLAFNAAQRMGATEKPQFSPLYLKAATGQGKTHLLHAIGHSFLQAHPRSRIFYCSAERFMVEFVQALKANQMLEFKARLRSFDLLLVDDIQFIIGKASAQEELLYTIDALLAEGKRLVFAADRAPQALDGVEPRLLSRLSMGLVADIQAADIELRKKILTSKLTRFAPLEVPGDVLDFLARTITRNIRELVGGLNKLIAYAQLTGQEVSLQLAEEQLTDILSANRRRITIDEIQRTVCQLVLCKFSKWSVSMVWLPSALVLISTEASCPSPSTPMTSASVINLTRPAAARSMTFCTLSRCPRNSLRRCTKVTSEATPSARKMVQSKAESPPPEITTFLSR